VTVWLSTTQRKRDDWIRSVDEARRDAELQRTEQDAALREGRKVIVEWLIDSKGEENIVIANAGVEAIIEVHLITADFDSNDEPGRRWEWHPAAIEGEFYRYRSPSWYRQYLLPGTSARFGGRMINIGSSEAFKTARITEHLHGKTVVAEIAWSDATGRHWQRRGSEEPTQLSTPYVTETEMEAKT
jgi:hypothetical protein